MAVQVTLIALDRIESVGAFALGVPGQTFSEFAILECRREWFWFGQAGIWVAHVDGVAEGSGYH